MDQAPPPPPSDASAEPGGFVVDAVTGLLAPGTVAVAVDVGVGPFVLPGGARVCGSREPHRKSRHHRRRYTTTRSLTGSPLPGVSTSMVSAMNNSLLALLLLVGGMLVFGIGSKAVLHLWIFLALAVALLVAANWYGVSVDVRGGSFQWFYC